MGLCHKVIRSQNHPTAGPDHKLSLESSSKPWLIPDVKSQGTLPKGRKPPEECTRAEQSTSQLAIITIGKGRPVDLAIIY
jgi:hypothetical protein